MEPKLTILSDKEHDQDLTAKQPAVSIDPAYASEDEGDASKNPFRDPEVAAYYVDLYEKASYECRHVFDPTLEWERKEERKIVRRLDWYVSFPATC